jgi:NAD(P)-dependent dehydrogenase (short-subunit alcohol dehydrogenase family)
MASKAALLRFAEALADEASDAGIVVLAISPGLVRTAMTTRVFGDLRDDPDRWSPPSLTAELVEFIDSGALDRLSGRHVHAVRDDWRTLPARIDEIVASDSHALRVVED